MIIPIAIFRSSPLALPGSFRGSFSLFVSFSAAGSAAAGSGASLSLALSAKIALALYGLFSGDLSMHRRMIF
jgi:hypothetical protein